MEVSHEPLLFGTKAESISNVEVVLTKRITEIAGMVMDERGGPFGEATVVAFATESTRWYHKSRFVAQTDVERDGTFTTHGLSPGDYYVVAVDKRETADPSRNIENPEFLQSLAASARRIRVTEGQQVSVRLQVSSR